MKFIEKIRDIMNASHEFTAECAKREAQEYYENDIKRLIEKMARRGASSCLLPYRPSYYESIKELLKADGFTIHARTIEDNMGCRCTIYVVEW